MTNPLAPIATVKQLGQSNGARTIIILQEFPDGRFGYTSWGKTKADCARAKKVADKLYAVAGEALVLEDLL